MLKYSEAGRVGLHYISVMLYSQCFSASQIEAERSWEGLFKVFLWEAEGKAETVNPYFLCYMENVAWKCHAAYRGSWRFTPSSGCRQHSGFLLGLQWELWVCDWTSSISRATPLCLQIHLQCNTTQLSASCIALIRAFAGLCSGSATGHAEDRVRFGRN